MAINGASEEALGALVNPTELSARNNLGTKLLGTAVAGLTIGSTSKKEIRQNTAVDWMLNGVKQSQKAAAEVGFTATTHDISPNASTVQERCYTVYLTSAGALAILAGPQATGSGNAKIQITGIPYNSVILGYLRLEVAAGSTPFDATTNDLDAAHLTDTYVNFAEFQWTSGMI